jgi:elongation factor G
MTTATTSPTGQARILAIVGPAGTGKTTLVAALAAPPGAPASSIASLAAALDGSPEERAHHHSIDVAAVRLEHRGAALTLLDTPGIAELSATRPLALRAADLAVVVLSPVQGLGPELLRLWHVLDEFALPRVVVVSKCDAERCDFEGVLDELRTRIDPHADPVELMVVAPEGEHAFLDVVDELVLVPHGEHEAGEPVPEHLRDRERSAREHLLDDVVSNDDELLERYLAGEELGADEVWGALAHATRTRRLTPVFAVSGMTNRGVELLRDALVVLGTTREKRETLDEGTLGLVLGATSDTYQGATAMVAILDGSLSTSSAIEISTEQRAERVHQLLLPTLPKPAPTTRAHAGDVVLIPKLTAPAGAWLVAGRPAPPSVELPLPGYSVALEIDDQRSIEKVAQAAQRLAAEDPGLAVDREPDTHRILLTGMGATHLGLVLERLGRRSGVNVRTAPPRTPYRETIAAAVEVEGKHKKQTGGHGQYGVVVCRFKPAPRGSGIVFHDEIVGGAIPRTFIPAVEAGIREAAQQGGPHGFPVVDLEVHLVDGKHHPVDSSELSFKLAGALALRTALERAGTVVLEPISRLHLRVPTSAQGDVLGYLSARRGRILESHPDGADEVTIDAELPAAELNRLAVDLHSLTAGLGAFTSSHARYEVVPAALLENVLTPLGR